MRLGWIRDFGKQHSRLDGKGKPHACNRGMWFKLLKPDERFVSPYGEPGPGIISTSPV